MVKGIDSWEFPKEQSLVEDKPESGTQKYSKCQTPPYEKNKLLLNEYLGDFKHFEMLFFVEMGQTHNEILYFESLFIFKYIIIDK